jgi:glycosyl hydrolase family 18 (putative chitinase)
MNVRSQAICPLSLAAVLLAACDGTSTNNLPSAGGSGGTSGAPATETSGSGSGAASGTTLVGGSGLPVGESGASALSGSSESPPSGSSGTPAESGTTGAAASGAAMGSNGAGDEAGVVADASTGEGGLVAPGEGGVVTPDTKVVMYLPNWSGSYSSWATKIDFNKMTHLLLAFGTVNSGTNDWSMGAPDSDVQALAAAAHAKNVKVLVSIGGADDDIGIITRYQTQSNIAPLVANLDAFVGRLDLDGVDVDLERGGDMKSTSNYPAFVGALTSTFRPEGKLVTSALAQYIVQDAGANAALFTVIHSFDFINLMIYSTKINDYTNEVNWWVNTVGIPKVKLTWGVEFTSQLTVATVKQLTMASEAYGGVMVWEYSQPTEPQLWPAVQGAL